MATVAELIKMLSELPQDHQVILSSDAEGNTFSPVVDEFSLGQYTSDDDDYSGSFCHEEDHDDSMEMEGRAKGTEDYIPFNENAVVLWPVN